MIEFLHSVNWLGMIIGALIVYIGGALWYGPKMFGPAYMRENKYDADHCVPKIGMVVSFLYALLTSLFFALLAAAVKTGHAFDILVLLYIVVVIAGMSLGGLMNRYPTATLCKIHIGYDVASIIIIALCIKFL